MPFTVKKTFEIAVDKDKSLIVQLKENQKELLENCQDLVRFTLPVGQYAEENVEHGRIEQTITSGMYPCWKTFPGSGINRIIWPDSEVLLSIL
jgi:hypothetical protein